MAVLAPFISVIIPVQTLEERYPGGVERYELENSNPTYCRDEHLTRVGFMSPAGAKWFVDSITATSALELRGEKGFADLAVVEGFFGPTAPCEWLEHSTDGGECECWLRGTEPGELVVPEV